MIIPHNATNHNATFFQNGGRQFKSDTA